MNPGRCLLLPDTIARSSDRARIETRHALALLRWQGLSLDLRIERGLKPATQGVDRADQAIARSSDRARIETRRISRIAPPCSTIARSSDRARIETIRRTISRRGTDLSLDLRIERGLKRDRGAAVYHRDRLSLDLRIERGLKLGHPAGG